MDATAFKLLERKRRFKPQTIEIAKRRILRREPATALAAEYGVNLQRIYTIENQVTAAWQGLHLPAGWSEITLVAPKPLIAEFKRRSRAARKQLLRKTERRIQLGKPPESPLGHRVLSSGLSRLPKGGLQCFTGQARCPATPAPARIQQEYEEVSAHV